MGHLSFIHRRDTDTERERAARARASAPQTPRPVRPRSPRAAAHLVAVEEDGLEQRRDARERQRRDRLEERVAQHEVVDEEERDLVLEARRHLDEQRALVHRAALLEQPSVEALDLRERGGERKDGAQLHPRRPDWERPPRWRGARSARTLRCSGRGKPRCDMYARIVSMRSLYTRVCASTSETTLASEPMMKP